MNLDIVEIALDYSTDGFTFEKIASEVMRDERYHDIRPLGGVGDRGQDAVEDKFYYREGRVRTVFQYTLEDYVEGKLRTTVRKLKEHAIEYSQLVIVTMAALSATRQRDLTKFAREEYDLSVDIYERKTLVNRLSDFSNGIFHRHFPDIGTQIANLSSRQPNLATDDGRYETALLKASLAFVFGKGPSSTRKAILDNLVLFLVYSCEEDSRTLEDISKGLTESLRCDAFPDAQILAAIRRLEKRGLVRATTEQVTLTSKAVCAVESATREANRLSSTFVSDIVEEVSKHSRVAVSAQERARLESNTYNVLAEFFRLGSVELANQVLEEKDPYPLYLESADHILRLAKRRVSPILGDLLIGALGEALLNPTEEESRTLANWSRAYIGAAVMNLDPVLRQVQASRLQEKTFILDTDVVLRCIVTEHPQSGVYLDLIRKLHDLGCSIIIPHAVVSECATHAMLSPRTYKFFGTGLLAHTKTFVHHKVRNVFVQGFYHAATRGPHARWSFERYLENYYDPHGSVAFLQEVISVVFPPKVKILDTATPLEEGDSKDLVRQVSDQLFKLLEKSAQASYRTPEQTQELADTDAQLFVTALRLNSTEAELNVGQILGGTCYILTNSSRYLRSAKSLGIRDVVTARPQQVLSIIELVHGPTIDDASFVKLFDNPFLIYAVDQAWEDIQAMIANGIVLSGKSLVRLRRDLDTKLHSSIIALRTVDERAEAAGEEAPSDAGDSEFLVLVQEAKALGYPVLPIIESLTKAVEHASSEAEAARLANEELAKRQETLEAEIARFGKRRQRYLRRHGAKPLG